MELRYVTLLLQPVAGLEAFLAEQQMPSSPNYRRWLTPEQFADRFGLSTNDIGKLTAWLQGAGLTVHDVTLDYLQPADGLAALASGHVDAWDIWSPFVEQAEAQDHARPLVTGVGYGSPYSFTVASRGALQDPAKAAAIRDYLKLLAQAHARATACPTCTAFLVGAHMGGQGGTLSVRQQYTAQTAAAARARQGR